MNDNSTDLLGTNLYPGDYIMWYNGHGLGVTVGTIKEINDFAIVAYYPKGLVGWGAAQVSDVIWVGRDEDLPKVKWSSVRLIDNLNIKSVADYMRRLKNLRVLYCEPEKT